MMLTHLRLDDSRILLLYFLLILTISAFCVLILVIGFNELFMGNPPVDRVHGQQLPTIGPTLDYLDTDILIYPIYV